MSLSFTRADRVRSRGAGVPASPPSSRPATRWAVPGSTRPSDLPVERQAFLAEAGELLTQSLDPDATLQRLASLAVHHIADWCGVESGRRRRHAAQRRRRARGPEARSELAHELRERYPIDPDAETGVPNVIRTGTTELYTEIPDELLVEAAVDDEHLRAVRELGLRSAMIVPLRARGRVFGAISYVASDPERRYDEADVALAEDLARRAALAIDNAMLFRREHDAARDASALAAARVGCPISRGHRVRRPLLARGAGPRGRWRLVRGRAASTTAPSASPSATWPAAGSAPPRSWAVSARPSARTSSTVTARTRR